MKNIITFFFGILITITLILPHNVNAQAPQKMSYQAVIRNSSNALVTITTVGMRISILKDSPTGIPVYVETQTTLTNANGLVSLSIGTGTIVTGTFSGINWATGPYFIKTETDPTGGTAYTITGTNELMSVPFALFSANSTPGPSGPPGADGSLNAWGLLGTTDTVDGTNFIGTTDNEPFNIRVNNQKAGRIDVSTAGNTFFGYQSGNSNSGNNFSTGIGQGALLSNTTGDNNTALGYGADVLTGNLTNATAIGYNAKTARSNSLVLGGTGVDAVNVGIGTTTPNTKAALDITSTTKGFLPPRLNSAQQTALNIGSPPAGLIIYNTTTNDLECYNGTKWVSLTLSPTYTIGLHPELGGYVFYLSSDGRHGLVAETLDITDVYWRSAQDAISRPGTHSVDGRQFRDWRMPTLYELQEMYTNRSAIGGFDDSDYYSSTIWVTGDGFWGVRFFTGSQLGVLDFTDAGTIRAVRSF